jgi:hypothetical protein
LVALEGERERLIIYILKEPRRYYEEDETIVDGQAIRTSNSNIVERVSSNNGTHNYGLPRLQVIIFEK